MDPCDAPAVSDFLQGKKSAKEDIFAGRGSSARSKSRTNVFCSPNGRSGGTGRRPTPGKVQEGNPDQTQESNPDQSQEMNANQTQEHIDDLNVNDDHWSVHPADHDFPDNDMPHPDDADAGCVDDSDDDDDPWRPLNPHEPGNLKIRTCRKGIASYLLDAIFSLFYILFSRLTFLNIRLDHISYSVLEQ